MVNKNTPNDKRKMVVIQFLRLFFCKYTEIPFGTNANNNSLNGHENCRNEPTHSVERLANTPTGNYVHTLHTVLRQTKKNKRHLKSKTFESNLKLTRLLLYRFLKEG